MKLFLLGFVVGFLPFLWMMAHWYVTPVRRLDCWIWFDVILRATFCWWWHPYALRHWPEGLLWCRFCTISLRGWKEVYGEPNPPSPFGHEIAGAKMASDYLPPKTGI